MPTQPIKPITPVIAVNALDPQSNVGLSDTNKSADSAEPFSMSENKDVEVVSEQENGLQNPGKTYASFSIYHPSGYAVVKIVDAETGEVICQHPPNVSFERIAELNEDSQSFDHSA